MICSSEGQFGVHSAGTKNRKEKWKDEEKGGMTNRLWFTSPKPGMDSSQLRIGVSE